MERKLATIRTISEILPIEGADNICVVKIDGWQCVAKIGEFKVGDFCVYCELDSLLPIKPEFEFLRKSCYKKMFDGTEGFRIKTARLRGTLSQGIAFPLSILEGKIAQIDGIFLATQVYESRDVTELLGIVKYEPYIPAQLAGTVKGPFPSYCSKSDEERIQNVPWVLEKYQDIPFYVTEKLDGSSVTLALHNGEFSVCSRNLELLETPDNTFWRVAREMKIEEKLRGCNINNIALQGELVGEGVQKNKYKLKGQLIYFYNAYDILLGKYLNWSDYNILMSAQLDLPQVPLLYAGITLPKTMDEMLAMADGKSMLNTNQNREGIVLRPLVETYDSNMPYGGRLSFKVISNKYLLKDED